MPGLAQRWTLILAGGSGTRLHCLTVNDRGRPVPKQFCSLNGGASLLEETLARAHAFSAEARTVVIVAAEHREFWRHALAHVPADNVIVQPRNRGTANGILLGTTAILARDPQALVTILPSDHFVGHEDVLRRALSQALAIAERTSAPEAIHFLGVEPEAADPQLGYIVCGEPLADGSVEIARFIEKPSREEARRLLETRALWNSFILVAKGAALVGLIERRYPSEVRAFTRLWKPGGGALPSQPALESLYARLPEIDFSRGAVQGANAALRVVAVPYCGWSDLGTPERVADCLGRVLRRPPAEPSRHFNLADAYARAISKIAPRREASQIV